MQGCLGVKANQSMCLDLLNVLTKCIRLMTKLSQNFFLFLLFPLGFSLQAQNDPDVPTEVSDEAAALRALIREYDAKSSGGTAPQMPEKAVAKVENEAERLKREAEEKAKAKEQAKETIASVTALIENEIEPADTLIGDAAAMNATIDSEGKDGEGVPAIAEEKSPPVAPADTPPIPSAKPEIAVPQVSVGTDRIILSDPGVTPASPPAEEQMNIVRETDSAGSTPSFAPDESLNLIVPEDPPAEQGDAEMAQAVAPAPPVIGTETPPQPSTLTATNEPASAADVADSAEPADAVAGVDMKPTDPADSADSVEGTEEPEATMPAVAEETTTPSEPAPEQPEKPTALAIKKSNTENAEVAAASDTNASDQPRAVARQLAPKLFQNLFPRKGSIFKRQAADSSDGSLDSSEED